MHWYHHLPANQTWRWKIQPIQFEDLKFIYHFSEDFPAVCDPCVDILLETKPNSEAQASSPPAASLARAIPRASTGHRKHLGPIGDNGAGHPLRERCTLCVLFIWQIVIFSEHVILTNNGENHGSKKIMEAPCSEPT